MSVSSKPLSPCQPSIGFSNRFFLLKTEIHTQILTTKPFLCNFRGLRNLKNKIELLIKLMWSKLKLFDLKVLYFEIYQDKKKVLTSIINMSCSDTDIFWRKGHKMKWKFGDRDTCKFRTSGICIGYVWY